MQMNEDLMIQEARERELEYQRRSKAAYLRTMAREKARARAAAQANKAKAVVSGLADAFKAAGL